MPCKDGRSCLTFRNLLVLDRLLMLYMVARKFIGESRGTLEFLDIADQIQLILEKEQFQIS